MLVGKREPAAVRGINVKPTILVSGDGRKFRQRIDDAGRSRAGKANDAARS